MELYGVRIPTIITENVAVRCAGCGGIVRGTPWRISILDIVSSETPPSWAESTKLNPGPVEFHADPSHVLAWLAQRGTLFCRRSQVREIMRPVWLPPAADGDEPRLGVCDGIHRDDHEFVEASSYATPAETQARPTEDDARRAEAEARAPKESLTNVTASPDQDANS